MNSIVKKIRELGVMDLLEVGDVFVVQNRRTKEILFAHADIEETLKWVLYKFFSDPNGMR